MGVVFSNGENFANVRIYSGSAPGVVCFIRVTGILFQHIPRHSLRIYVRVVGGIPYGYCCPFLFNEFIADPVYCYSNTP